MVDLSSANGDSRGGGKSAPMQLANAPVQVRVGNSPPSLARSRTKRARAASSSPTPTVSLVIPVRNEARNIAWVLEQIADEVNEIINAVLLSVRSSSCRAVVISHAGAADGMTQRDRAAVDVDVRHVWVVHPCPRTARRTRTPR